jgi:hypothetical protein
MSQDHRRIDTFLARVRRRLNRHRLWTTLIWTLATAAGAIAFVGVWYTSRGYAVPRTEIVALLSMAFVAGGAVWSLRRLSPDGAARVADRLFGLRDAITSYLHFSREGRRDGFYALQADQTCARVEPLDPHAIKYEPPRRGIALAACLVAIAVPLGLRAPSEVRFREQQLAEETAVATLAINDELAKLVEELQQAAPDAEEKELLDPNKLRQWVEELKETSDHKEALRQYAQLERKFNQARLALQNKRDEQLLERAARKLETSRETQPLAEQLNQKNYDRSAEELEKMRPTSKDKPLSKQRQELARLKAAAQHMAAAARASQSAASSAQASAAQSSAAGKSESNRSRSSGGEGAAAGAASSGSGDMAETMEDLAQAVADLDQALADAERQESQRGQCDEKQLSKCDSCSNCVGSELDKLCKQLKKLGMCQRTDKMLCKLCQACSQCQGNLSSLCQSPHAGGKQAGMGTNTARRSQLDELIDNGMTTQLKGVKGRGPSLTTTESADEGSGTSTRRATANQRTFKRQFESFVAREDVPHEVKDGVKEYFQVIHQIAPAPTPEETTPNADHGT